MDPEPEIRVEFSKSFGAAEYAVFSAVLVASTLIGVYYGFFDNKKKEQTTEDYLLGGKKMGVLPVSLSLLTSFVSAITLLGNPVEVYFYGSQYVILCFAFIPITLALIYLYVPVYFRLQLTSAYEYFEIRFDRSVRISMSVISIIYMVIFMAIAVYGPSLALSHVAGINDKLCTALIFAVCIFYSSLGGLKAVLWSNALQAVVMIGSLIAVVSIGISEIGGWQVMWDRADMTGRVEFFNFDPDLRTRQTFWSNTIGGYLGWIPLFAATQSQIQRYISVSSLRKARQALIINMFGMMLLVFLCFLAGMAIYAKYYLCDPIKTEVVSASDQLLPLFVMDILSEYPGLPGLFVAGITAASLSSVSAGLNSLAAIVTEDYVKKWKPNVSDVQLSRISKIISLGFGVLSFAFTFVAEFLGDIFPAALLLVGTFLGPTFGLFTLGMFFPWVNAFGAMGSLISGIGLMLFISIGSLIAGDEKLPNQKLPLYVSLQGCNDTFGNAHILDESYLINSPADLGLDWKDQEYSPLIKILSLANTWYPGVGCISTVIFGILFSAFSYQFLKFKRKPVPDIYLAKPIVKLYYMIFPRKFMDKWISFEDQKLPLSNSSNNNEELK